MCVTWDRWYLLEPSEQWLGHEKNSAPSVWIQLEKTQLFQTVTEEHLAHVAEGVSAEVKANVPGKYISYMLERFRPKSKCRFLLCSRCPQMLMVLWLELVFGQSERG